MPRFFVTDEYIDDAHVRITGEDAHHISRSLRMAAGEHITVSDASGYEYDCILESFEETCVRAKIVSRTLSDTELPVRVHLYQAMPKGDKLDLIIQKAVECGAYDITPFESERCVVRIKPEAEARKTERRSRIAYEAAKQCRRAVIPKVLPTCDLRAAFDAASVCDAVLFCYEGKDTVPMKAALRTIRSERELHDIAVIIGSEGGFSPAEAQLAEERGFYQIGLGKRILRTETASIFALAALVYELEL